MLEEMSSRLPSANILMFKMVQFYMATLVNQLLRRLCNNRSSGGDSFGTYRNWVFNRHWGNNS